MSTKEEILSKYRKNIHQQFDMPDLSDINGIVYPDLTALIPGVMGKLGGILKDQDGDGDVDINDILITLKGGNKSTSSGSGLLGAATSILGGLLKKK